MRVWEWLETIALKSLGVRVVFEFFGKVRGCGFLIVRGALQSSWGGRNGFECARKVQGNVGWKVLGKFEGVGVESAWAWARKVRGYVRVCGRGGCVAGAWVWALNVRGCGLGRCAGRGEEGVSVRGYGRGCARSCYRDTTQSTTQSAAVPDSRT